MKSFGMARGAQRWLLLLCLLAAWSGARSAVSSRRLLFLIGPNKTGTRSWAQLLQEAFGLRVLHDAASWSRASRAHDQAFFSEGEWDAFADGEAFDVEWLATTFPTATFLFNTRPLLPWLVSRHFHVQDSTHAFLAGHVKSLALHNDDATVACWVMQRDAALSRAQALLQGTGRLAVLDITAAEASPKAFFSALEPILPGRMRSEPHDIPHKGLGHAASLPPARYDAVEAQVVGVLKRMGANESATGLSGAHWTDMMLSACGRLYGMGGVGTERRRGNQLVHNDTSSQHA
mmetsp:Transcript_14161/g.38471  ORF Transcript_14161/g.38471 Transcript_14161/m.38471 type:complete len:290 (-) Transcript_14161:384-1253(-)